MNDTNIGYTWQILLIRNFSGNLGRQNGLVGAQGQVDMQNTRDVHFKVQMNNLQGSNLFLLGGQEELKITYPFSYIAVLQNTL